MCQGGHFDIFVFNPEHACTRYGAPYLRAEYTDEDALLWVLSRYNFEAYTMRKQVCMGGAEAILTNREP